MTIKYNILTTIFLAGLTVSVAVASARISASEIVNIGLFSKKDLSGWKEKSFAGNTEYVLQGGQGSSYLSAKSDMSASALYKKTKVDIKNTPYLNWSWKIKKGLTALQEQSKEGDDYAARVYVIVKLGLAPWKTKALNYVWSGAVEPDRAWLNAYTEKAMMIPLRSSVDAKGSWQYEKVNVYLDFKKYFDIDVESIHGVAIMTDTDNSNLSAIADYGDIYFSKQ